MKHDDWKPGDVAICGEELVGLNDDAIWIWVMTGLACTDQRSVARRVRPVVIIDPEDREAAKHLLAEFCRAVDASDIPVHPQGWSADAMQAALREFVNPKPQRIDEPGTWGVVEAACVHSDIEREWVRFPSGNWHAVRRLPGGCEDIENPDDWDSLVDPVLVREGIQS